MAAPRRGWTLETAREVLADVRRRTAQAVEEVEKLLAERESTPAGSSRELALGTRIQDAVSAWARAMEALGLEVKGLWLVDFDNGDGYYCWRWPETDLEYFHGYEEGFAGRIRIQ